MRDLTFTVSGQPVAFARSGSNGRVRFIPAKQRHAGNHVAAIAFDAMAGAALFEGPLRVSVLAVWPWPKSMTAKLHSVTGAHFRTSRPDADNIDKLLCDACNGVILQDDAQICVLAVEKQFGQQAFSRISIEALGGQA